MDELNDNQNSTLVETDGVDGPLQPSLVSMEPQKRKFKHKSVLIVVVVSVVLALVSFGTYLVIRSKTGIENQKPQSASTEQDVERQDTATFSGSFEGIEGLEFTVPDGWSITKRAELSGGNYALYSPEVNSVVDGFMPLYGGYSVNIMSRPREIELEKNSDKVINAYISKIGAPRINPSDFDNLDKNIDYSRFSYFKNEQNIDFMAYPWAYEGCSLNIVMLGASLVYNIGFQSGIESCPSLEALSSNSGLKALISSIKLTDSTGVIHSSSKLEYADNKEAGSEITYADSDLRILFKLQADPEYRFYLVGSASVMAKLDSGQKLQKILFNSSSEAIKSSIDCDGCGILNVVYDSFAQVSTDPVNKTGFETISDTIIGKVESVTPVQSDPKAQAKKFTYVKSFAKNSVIFSFVAETVSTDGLPSLQDEFLIKSVESIDLN